MGHLFGEVDRVSCFPGLPVRIIVQRIPTPPSTGFLVLCEPSAKSRVRHLNLKTGILTSAFS